MGYIYLIENTIDNSTKYKIGYTNNISRRLKELSTGNPGELNIIKQFETKWDRKVETIMHKKYKYLNIKNEWFTLTEKNVNSFLYDCGKIEKNFDFLYKYNNTFF